MSLEQRAREGFQRLFQADPPVCFQAPGRVNLIGEHTDYNDGFVLPAAIDFHTLVAGRPRQDRQVRVHALDLDEAGSEFNLDQPILKDPKAPWADYVRGVCQVLLSEEFHLTGADLVIAGNVPQGAGLSSSASLEVVTAKAMTGLSGEKLSATQAAILGQRAENEFVGCQCGIMDQLISACGKTGHATLIDCRSLETRSVALPDQAAIIIVNSNVKRGLVGSEYNTRRAQCEAAARIMEVPALRDADLDRLENFRHRMDALTYRRARHIITENCRTLAAVEAFQTSDWQQIQQLMAASHHSMRDDFEITVPPIDGLVEIIAEALGSKGGVRMTGGGFGGCVVALAPESLVPKVIQAVEARYQTEYGIQPDLYVCHPVDGAFSEG